MGAWYTIGLFAGIGVGAGVVFAGVLGSLRGAAALAAVLGAVAGALLGLGLADTEEAIGGAVGGLLGGFGASLIVTAALGRGGTRGATAFLVAFAGVGLAVLALVPIVGYLEAVALPVLGARLRRRADGRYQGLRILARD